MATMRSVMNLQINLGLFGFAVKVYKATDEPADGVSFRQLHATCGTPINAVKRCQTCQADVPHAHLAKGHEVTAGKFVTVTDDELKALKPVREGMVRVVGYLHHDDHPHETVFDGASYYLMPAAKDATTFVTWRDALSGRAALGKVVLYGRERVVSIRASGRALVMVQLRTQAERREVNNVPGYDSLPLRSDPGHRQLMSQVMDMSETTLHDVQIEQDAYVVAVRALLESKMAGVDLPAPQLSVAPSLTAGSLIEALKATLAKQAQAA